MRRLVALGATVVAVLLGVVPGVVAPSAGAPAFPPIRPTRVLVLGDSVMKGAATVYATKLPGRDVVVDAEVNRTTGQGADIVAKVGTDWDVVVILLGHNDGGSPGVYQPAARRILDQLRGVRRVVWLTIHEVRPYYPAVNQYIASLQRDYPNLRTGDWNAVASAHPEGLAGDGLHLNGTGADLMATLVADQVHLAELEWHGALKALAPTTTTTTTPPTTTTAPPTTAPPTATSTTSTRRATTDAADTTAPTLPSPVPGATAEGSRDADQTGPLIVGAMMIAFGAIAFWSIRRSRRRGPNA